MPAGDGTGPRGMGSMTGRGAGYCGGTDVPGYATAPGRGSGLGWGSGRAWGRGGGWGRGFFHPPFWARRAFGRAWGPVGAQAPYAEPTREQEAEYLKQQAGYLQGELDAISQRVSELEQET
jgi:hypothetical protein